MPLVNRLLQLLPPPLADMTPGRTASPLLVSSPRHQGGSHLLQGGGRASPRPFSSAWPISVPCQVSALPSHDLLCHFSMLDALGAS